MSEFSRIRDRLVLEGREPTLGAILDEMYGREKNPLRRPDGDTDPDRGEDAWDA